MKLLIINMMNTQSNQRRFSLQENINKQININKPLLVIDIFNCQDNSLTNFNKKKNND
jgi:hypothetical protein